MADRPRANHRPRPIHRNTSDPRPAGAGAKYHNLDNFLPQVQTTEARIAADIEPHVRLLVGQSVYEVCRYEQTNLSGSAALYELLAKTPDRGVERIVVPSSRDLWRRCYGREKDGIAHPAARASFLHSDTKRDYRDFRDENMRHGMADMSVAKALLGYEPRWRFRDEVRRFLE